MGVFRTMSVDSTNRANIGCHFQGTALLRPTRPKGLGYDLEPLRGKIR
jgi:hypothetical protein